MTHWIKYFTLLLLISFSCVVQAKHKKTHHLAHSSPPQKTHSQKISLQKNIIGSQALGTEINHILQSVNERTSISIAIKSMDHGEMLYTKNEQELLTPASTMKIMTAEAALLYLGSDYQFTTALLTDTVNINNGIVNGNIYLVLNGDPTLTYTDLIHLMDALNQQHIQEIVGNVYIDTTAFDQANYGPGWEWDDKRNCFAAPINASIINHNCLSLQMTPGTKIGQIANIIPSSQYYYATINNNVITKRAHTHSCFIQLGMDENNSISLSGCMPKGKYAWGFSTTISNVAAYNKALIQSLLQHFNILIKGYVSTGTASTHLSNIASHQSEPLSTLVKNMLKMSDNIIASSLFKKLGEYYTQQPGSWENGSLAVKSILKNKAAVNTDGLQIIDGSGLSRDNKIQAMQLLQVLDYAYHDPSTHNEFISSLPIASVDGTLKHRLYNVKNKVHAKTGTMQGVTSLAGYVIDKNNETIAFAIIVNTHKENIWHYREIEDKIVTVLANYSRDSS